MGWLALIAVSAIVGATIIAIDWGRQARQAHRDTLTFKAYIHPGPKGLTNNMMEATYEETPSRPRGGGSVDRVRAELTRRSSG